MLQAFESLSSTWSAGIAGAALKTAALIVLASLIVRVVPRVSVSMRHLIWLCAMTAGLVLPVLTIVLPTWHAVPAEVHPRALYEQMTASTPAVVDEAASASMPNETVVENRAVMDTDATPIASTTRSVPFPWPSKVAMLFVLWLVGAVVVATSLLTAILRLSRTVRETGAIDDPVWTRLLADGRERMGVTRTVAIRFHPDAIMPAVCGFLRPTILLPSDAVNWPHKRKRVVLLHELAHVARWDVITQNIAHLACIIHWFNPLMWFARRESVRTRERACDDMVLQTGVSADDYARDVLHVAASFSGRQSVAMGFARKSDLESRLVAIVKPTMDRRGVSSRRRLTVLALAVMTVLPLSAVAFSSEPEEPARSEVVESEMDAGRPSRLVASEPARLAGKEPAETTDVDAEATRLIEALKLPDTRPDAVAEIEALGRNHPVVKRVIERLYRTHRSDEALFRTYSTVGVAKERNPDAVAGLIEMLDDEYAVNRAAAARALKSIGGPSAVDRLVKALSDESPSVREWSARALGSIGDPRAVDGLIAAIDDRSGSVREWVVRALGDISDPRAVEPLVRKLADRSATIREWAARSLGNIDDPRAVEPLIAALEDPSASVREWAVRSLGEIGDERAVDPLIARLGDSNRTVRGWAARALAELDYDNE